MLNLRDVLFFITACISVTSALPPCICTLNFKPVCGSDGVTYSNECMLECKRTENKALTLEKNGSCETSSPLPSACICTFEYKPVCGTDGKTYSNKCMLDCEKITRNIEVKYNGECRQKRDAITIKSLDFVKCVCTGETEPVCGTDGKTYSSPCSLNCAKAYYENLHIDHSGPCEKHVSQNGCTCSRDLLPVCASNGVTYSNECLMKCADENLTIVLHQAC